MPKLRTLSGTDVIKILVLFGFTVLVQRGSHVKLARETVGGRQTLTIANHKQLDKGTLSAIYRQAGRYISEAELRPHFYTQEK